MGWIRRLSDWRSKDFFASATVVIEAMAEPCPKFVRAVIAAVERFAALNAIGEKPDDV